MSVVADLPPIPDKHAFKIGEAAALVGVKAHVLRFWEREFPSVRPQKSRNGHRIYARADVERLRRIRSLLHERGYTIAGARSLLRDGEVAVEAALAARPTEAAAALKQTQAHMAELEAAVEAARAEVRLKERALARAREEAEFWRAEARKAEAGLEALQAVMIREADRLLELLDGPDDSMLDTAEEAH